MLERSAAEKVQVSSTRRERLLEDEVSAMDREVMNSMRLSPLMPRAWLDL